jgi:hypothetical protein
LKPYFSHPLPDFLEFCSQKCFQYSATALGIHDNGLVVFLKEITLYHNKLLQHMHLLEWNLAEKAAEVKLWG